MARKRATPKPKLYRDPPNPLRNVAKRTVHTGSLHIGGAIHVRRERSQTERKFRLHKPGWIDPYPQVNGTEPEKRIFEALMRLGIYFRFHFGTPTNIRKVDALVKDYDVDFTIPEYRVILDPFSPFHHSQAESLDRDALKKGIFSMGGWTVYTPWAVAPGVFVLDEDAGKIGRWTHDWQPVVGRDAKGRPRLLYTRRADTPHVRVFGALELIEHLPALQGGPKYPLADPLDLYYKKLQGYRVGSHYGAGFGAVAAANRARRRPPVINISRAY